MAPTGPEESRVASRPFISPTCHPTDRFSSVVLLLSVEFLTVMSAVAGYRGARSGAVDRGTTGRRPLSGKLRAANSGHDCLVSQKLDETIILK